RNTSVNGSENVPGWDSLTILSWVTAYHSFGGEVEASNTPTIRRLTPSRRHQLPRITPEDADCAIRCAITYKVCGAVGSIANPSAEKEAGHALFSTCNGYH